MGYEIFFDIQNKIMNIFGFGFLKKPLLSTWKMENEAIPDIDKLKFTDTEHIRDNPLVYYLNTIIKNKNEYNATKLKESIIKAIFYQYYKKNNNKWLIDPIFGIEELKNFEELSYFPR